MKKSFATTVARAGALAALAALLAYIETLLPPLFAAAPGVKIGLGNIVVLLALMLLGLPYAGVILAVKCLLGALYGGNVFGLVYSLSGGCASLAVMAALYLFCYRRLSIVAISVAGAAVHNLVQTAVACAVVWQLDYFAMLPLVLAASAIAGTVVGLAAWLIVRCVPLRVLTGRA